MAKEVRQELVSQCEDTYRQLQILLESLHADLLKCASGNAAAGVRVRKDLRLLRTKVSDAVKTTVTWSDAYRPSSSGDSSGS
jgi:hypothetical protein